MSELTTFGTSFKIIGPTGKTVYQGIGKIMNPMEWTSAEASATALAGEAIRIDHATTVFTSNVSTVLGRWESIAAGVAIPADEPITETVYGLRSTTVAADNVCWLGINISDNVAAGRGVLAGTGSIGPVICINPPTSNLIGSNVIASTSVAGSVDTVAATPTVARKFGLVIKIAGTTGGVTDTGSATFLGALVAPW